MKNALKILALILFMAASATAQQSGVNRNTTPNRSPQSNGNVGTGLSNDQVNAATAGSVDKDATNSPRRSTSIPNSNNETSAAAGTGNTLDQNAGASSVTPGAGANNTVPTTRTDNTSSIITGHSTNVKANKIKPRQKNR